MARHGQTNLFSLLVESDGIRPFGQGAAGAMLTISPAANRALNEMARPAFLERVRLHLADAYPHFLPCFPHPVQSQIVANMLNRASGWGLSQQASLYAFCELMIAVAPNFDEVPSLRAIMERDKLRLDWRITEYKTSLPRHLMAEAYKVSSHLPFYCAPTNGATIAKLTTAALPIVLFDKPERADAARAVAKAQAALPNEYSAFPDALLVVAVCRALWGSEFMRLPWAVALYRQRRAPRAWIEFLRLRIALEFGRFV